MKMMCWACEMSVNYFVLFILCVCYCIKISVILYYVAFEKAKIHSEQKINAEKGTNHIKITKFPKRHNNNTHIFYYNLSFFPVVVIIVFPTL